MTLKITKRFLVVYTYKRKDGCAGSKYSDLPPYLARTILGQFDDVESAKKLFLALLDGRVCEPHELSIWDMESEEPEKGMKAKLCLKT